MNISPCMGCEKCSLTGDCIIRDEMYKVYEEIEACKYFLFLSPVFFGGVTATLKSAIDRCQPFWARKNILGKKIDNFGRKGLIVLIGGTFFTKGYECAALSVRWLFNVIEVSEVKSLFYMNIEKNKDFLKYDIEKDINNMIDFFFREGEK
jgi:multimeric flavodoxin WrbA